MVILFENISIELGNLWGEAEYSVLRASIRKSERAQKNELIMQLDATQEFGKEKHSSSIYTKKE